MLGLEAPGNKLQARTTSVVTLLFSTTASMSTAVDTGSLRQRPVNGARHSPSEEGKKTDKLLDSHTEWVSR